MTGRYLAVPFVRYKDAVGGHFKAQGEPKFDLLGNAIEYCKKVPNTFVFDTQENLTVWGRPK